MSFVSTLVSLDRLRQFEELLSRRPGERDCMETFACYWNVRARYEGRLIVLEREFEDCANEANGSQPTLLKLQGSAAH